LIWIDTESFILSSLFIEFSPIIKGLLFFIDFFERKLQARKNSVLHFPLSRVDSTKTLRSSKASCVNKQEIVIPPVKSS
jgi:hypothetical protein